MSILPSRRTVLAKIAALSDQSESREQIAAWSFSILDDDSVEVTDQDVRTVLELLGAADLPSTDRDYLYGEEDFAEWRMRLS